jgi:hypothetical protein
MGNYNKWPAERTHALYRLWVIEGLSASKIARAINYNISRSGIIGKVSRMEWDGHQGEGWSRETAPEGFPVPADRTEHRRELRRTRKPRPVPEPKPEPVPLFPNQCRRPECGHTMQPQNRYGLCAECNHKRITGRLVMEVAAE